MFILDCTMMDEHLPFMTMTIQQLCYSGFNRWIFFQESNVQALDILFTYHGAELLQHRLAVLNNFPETTSPHEYTILLPEAW